MVSTPGMFAMLNIPPPLPCTTPATSTQLANHQAKKWVWSITSNSSSLVSSLSIPAQNKSSGAFAMATEKFQWIGTACYQIITRLLELLVQRKPGNDYNYRTPLTYQPCPPSAYSLNQYKFISYTNCANFHVLMGTHC